MGRWGNGPWHASVFKKGRQTDQREPERLLESERERQSERERGERGRVGGGGEGSQPLRRLLGASVTTQSAKGGV